MTQRDCTHGQLARVCNVCELEAEVATLRAKLPAGKPDEVCGTCGDQGVVCIGNNLEGQEYDPCPDCCPPAAPDGTEKK